jgi:hypothetical protein
VEARAIVRTLPWERVPAYAFCVLAPLLQSSVTWRPRYKKAKLAAPYARQGLLFERISDEALRGAGWHTHLTGWSSGQSLSLPAVVTGVAGHIGESEYANWARNVSPDASEVGLDVVFFRPFKDGRCGIPIFLTQCATGADWDTNLHTPVLAVC